MQIEVFSFPTINDGIEKVEEFYCMLLNKYRSGEYLSCEVIDWLDTANTWLIQYGNSV